MAPQSTCTHTERQTHIDTHTQTDRTTNLLISSNVQCSLYVHLGGDKNPALDLHVYAGKHTEQVTHVQNMVLKFQAVAQKIANNDRPR